MSRLKLFCAASVIAAGVLSSVSAWALPAASEDQEKTMAIEIGDLEWSREKEKKEKVSELLREYEFKFSKRNIVDVFDALARDGFFNDHMDFLDLLLKQKFSAETMAKFLHKTALHYQYHDAEASDHKHRLAPVMIKLLNSDPMDSTQEQYGIAYQKTQNFMRDDVREAFYRRGMPISQAQPEFKAAIESYKNSNDPSKKRESRKKLSASLKGDKTGSIISGEQRKELFWLAVHAEDNELSDSVLENTQLIDLVTDQDKDIDKVVLLSGEVRDLLTEQFLIYHFKRSSEEQFSVHVERIIMSNLLDVLKKVVGEEAYAQRIDDTLQRAVMYQTKSLSITDIGHVLARTDFTPSQILIDKAMSNGKSDMFALFLSLLDADQISAYQLQLVEHIASKDVRDILVQRQFSFKGRLPDGRSVLSVFVKKVDAGIFSEEQLHSFLKHYVPSGLPEENTILKALASKGALGGLLGQEAYSYLTSVLGEVFQSLILQSEPRAAIALLAEDGLSSVTAPAEGFEPLVCNLGQGRNSSISVAAYELLGQWIIASGVTLEWSKVWECSKHRFLRGRLTVVHEAFLWRLISELGLTISAETALAFKTVIMDQALDYLSLVQDEAMAVSYLFGAIPALDKLAVSENGDKLEVNEDGFRHLFVTRDKFVDLHESESMKYFVNYVLVNYSKSIKKKILKNVYSANNLWLMAYLLSPESGLYPNIQENAGSYFTAFTDDVVRYDLQASDVAKLLVFRCILPDEDIGEAYQGVRQSCEAGIHTVSRQFGGSSGATSCSVEVGDCDDKLISGLPKKILDIATGK